MNVYNSAGVKKYLRGLENLFFVLYFIILFGERLAAVICGFALPEYAFIGSDDFVQWYAHILTTVSLCASVVFLVQARKYVISIFAGSPDGDAQSRSVLSVAAGLLLLGGMVHTNFTLLWLQFIAYGALLLSMLMRTLHCYFTADGTFRRGRLWISFLYILCFSMAIPVVYSTAIDAAAVFVPLEIATSLLLVAAFTVLLIRFYKSGGQAVFGLPLIIFTVAADTAIVILRWAEFANMFLAIFAGLTLVMWIIGRAAYGNIQLYAFAGKHKRHYFEGWYYKFVCGNTVVAFIPSFHSASDGKYAMLQVVWDGEPLTFRFGEEEFDARTDRLDVRIGGSSFSACGLIVDAEQNGHIVKGEVSFGKLHPLRRDIMGLFAAFPLMQCKHGVISMKHDISGAIEIDGKRFDFDGGLGYLEKDKGSSFPSGYTWTQGCDGRTSVMMSVATIPYAAISFTGHICAVVHNDKEYIFATYNGSRIKERTAASVKVGRGRLELTAEAVRLDDKALAAPCGGDMTRTVHESPAGEVRYRMTDGNNVIFDMICTAGYESSGSGGK